MTRFIIVHLRAIEHGRWSGGYFNSFSLSTASPLKGGNEWPGESCGIAPRSWVQLPPVHFLLRGKYGIKPSLFQDVVGQKPLSLRMFE